MKVSEARFVQKARIDNGSMVRLRGPGATRVTARNARRVCSTDRVLRIVVGETIDIHAEHQVLARGELVVHAAVKQELAIVTGVVEISIRGAHKTRPGGW